MKRLLLVIATGCEATLGVGDTCSSSEPCGDGAICDLTDPDGPICISTSGDLDGDGIPNGKDFCEHAAGGAHDEDKDGIGDDCDHCPIAPPRATPDADGDMVDSPCDPDPTEPGDVILLFDGFESGLGDWKPTTPSAWQAGTDEISVNLASVPDQDYLQHNVVGKLNLAIETAYRVDRIENSATRHFVGVYATDPRPAGVANMQCGVSRADTGTNDVVVIETNMGAMSQPTPDPALLSTKLYRTGAYANGTSAGCSVIVDNAGIGSVRAPITPEGMSSVALTARAASVRFEYVLVVGRD